MSEEQTAVVDFEGENNAPEFERVLVKEGEHQAKIVKLEVQQLKKYKSEEKEPNILMFFEVQEDNKQIPYFLKPKIMKAYSEDVSNSKLYNLLELAGLIEEAKKRKDELSTVTGQVMFLEEKLKGKVARISSKTVNKGKTNEDGGSREYSRVNEIFEFVDSAKSVEKPAEDSANSKDEGETKE